MIYFKSNKSDDNFRDKYTFFIPMDFEDMVGSLFGAGVPNV